MKLSTFILSVVAIFLNIRPIFGQSPNNNNLIISDLQSLLSQTQQNVRTYLSTILVDAIIKNVDAILNLTSVVNKNYGCSRLTTTTTTTSTTTSTSNCLLNLVLFIINSVFYFYSDNFNNYNQNKYLSLLWISYKIKLMFYISPYINDNHINDTYTDYQQVQATEYHNHDADSTTNAIARELAGSSTGPDPSTLPNPNLHKDPGANPGTQAARNRGTLAHGTSHTTTQHATTSWRHANQPSRTTARQGRKPQARQGQPGGQAKGKPTRKGRSRHLEGNQCENGHPS